MKLKELAKQYKCNSDLAAVLGIEVGNLRMLMSRGREIEQLKDGRWILITKKHKIFDITLD